MDINNLTAEEKKILAAGKLLAYCNDTIVAEPPSHAESICELFDSFSRTGYRKSGETPQEKLHDDFPGIAESELTALIGYFRQVKYYCDSVCSAYAMKYPYYPAGSGKTEEERADIMLVISACRQRYPWLKQEYIESHLAGTVAMCVR